MPQHDTTTEHAATGALADDTPSTPQQERETTIVSTALATEKPLGFKIQGEAAGDQAGVSVSAAGDVNADGIDDLIIGYRPFEGGPAAGYVLFGTDQGFPAVVDLAAVAQGQGGFKIQGESPDDGVVSVSTAGDVNGDGIDDLIVGAAFNNGGGSNAGAAYVILGSAQGFSRLIDLAVVAQGQGGFKIQGENPNDWAGWSVSSAGDVNGDGVDDLIVGAINQGSGGSFAGAAYLIFGNQGGFPDSIDLAAIAQGQGGFKIQGATGYDRAGWSVSSAGDINGDGFTDVIIGAPGDFINSVDKNGAAFIVFGTDRGFPAVVDLANLAQEQAGCEPSTA